MRVATVVLAAIFLAPTGAMASAGGELVGASELGAARPSIQRREMAPIGMAAIGQRNLAGGNVILAKGDQSGTGPGLGGHKGQKKGGGLGKQKESGHHGNEKNDKP